MRYFDILASEQQNRILFLTFRVLPKAKGVATSLSHFPPPRNPSFLVFPST